MNADSKTLYILDKKTGDVNGDRIPDTIFLVGEKTENPFYENIRVIVEDGRTLERFVIPLDPNYSIGYSPWLFIGSFTDSPVNEIMVNLPVGGSGALTYYYVIAFQNNQAEFLLNPEQFMELTETLEISVIYQDGYKVLVESKSLGQSYTLDIADRKDVYEGSVYDENGKLLEPKEGFMIDIPHLYPVKFDGALPYRLMSQQDISGTSHADRLGYVITYWQYNKEKGNWVLEPEMFFVML